jgi:TNF receptor-associated factor 4
MAGGFECAFAEKVSKGVQFECPICLLVLREPYQATCCGKSFCKECIHRLKSDFEPCPTCKEENFKLFYNKGLQQSLYDFQVYCTHKSKGCEWTGELRKLDNHLNSDPPADKSLQGCPFTLIKCPFGCEAKLARQDMPSHLKDTCKLLHSEHTLPARKEFQNIPIQFLNGEQLLNGSLRESGIEKERLFTSNRLVAPVQLIMTDFEQHRKSEDIWYSPGFYTRPGGYKMCLAVFANGWAEGRSKCISVYVHLMQGEFDDKIEWPFRGDVHVELLSWMEGGGENSKESHTRVIPFDESAQVLEYTAAGRVVGGEMAEIGRGLCKFASHRDIRAKYLKNDCLKVLVYFSHGT